MKILDIYILKKFLGTFFFAILLIISISVVFDIAEKIDDFMETSTPLKAIIFEYYINFVPYFVNLFTPLFVFIAVIFFTSKMAYQTEIIAILSSGVSFKRLLVPYMLGALIIGSISFVLSCYVIPPANRTRLKFEDTYVKKKKDVGLNNIHMQIEPGVFVYVWRYSSFRDVADDICIEKFDGRQLVMKIRAREAIYNKDSNYWQLNNYIKREILSDTLSQEKVNFADLDIEDKEKLIRGQIITTGDRLDTTLAVFPSDFVAERKFYETMTLPELNTYIDEQTRRGVGNVAEFEVEKHRRISMSFSSFILTIIGLSLASHKVRGGMGLHIGIGLALSFSYIMFMTVSTTFAINGNTPAWLACWIPNFIYAFIAAYLYKRAPK